MTGKWKDRDGRSGPGAEAFVVPPFTRLARTHAMGVAGDALFALAMAGTIFFLSPADAARTQVALYLLLTILPFAVAAPLIGPALDRIRGGRRWTIFGTAVARVLICLALVRHLDSLLFYPEAFLMLAFSKAYHISKSAVVPTTVHDDAELVEANSKLSLLSGLAVVLAAGPALVLLAFEWTSAVMVLAAICFVVMAVFALRLPKVTVAPRPRTQQERAELRSAGIRLAATVMSMIRGIVGFLAFLLAFELKAGPAWKLGVVAATAQAGYLLGSLVAPRLRKVVLEDNILLGAVITIAITAVGAMLTAGLGAAAILSCVVGIASSTGKQSFDAIVQRDAPDANRGRSFARFETRFQIIWVVGALVPTALPMDPWIGYLVLAVAAIIAAVLDLAGRRGLHFDARSRLREWRRRKRVGLDDETAARLGFRPGQVFEQERPPVADPPDAGLTDHRPVSPLEPSPAAEAARRRREKAQAEAAAEAAASEAAARKELAQAERAMVEEDAEPDLDWHPH